jgi:ADP-heptose:LPS heptosyltransferase
VNLQYGEVTADLERAKAQLGIEVYHESEVDNRNDLEGLAGLIDACDEIISVGNATAHLAGALGKKTLVLLPFVAGWRWLHEGERCPWYDSVTLLRQTVRDDWSAVLAQVNGRLSLQCCSRSSA